MKREKGRITISRVQSNQSKKGWITIHIGSDNHDRIITVDVPLETFALCITGLGSQECDLTRYKT